MSALSSTVFLSKLTNIKLAFSIKTSCFFLNNSLGSISTILMPSLYFFKQTSNLLGFLFLSKSTFRSFVTNIYYFINLRLYFVKIRIRGLGYRYRSLCYNVHYFFFNYTITTIFLIQKIYLLKFIKSECYY